MARKINVNLDFHVVYKKNRYSCPYQYSKKKVDLKVTDRFVEIYYKGERLTSHNRFPDYMKNKYSTHPEDMPPAFRNIVQWDDERIRNWASSIGKSARQVIDRIFGSVSIKEQGYNICSLAFFAAVTAVRTWSERRSLLERRNTSTMCAPRIKASRDDLLKKVSAVAGVANIPEIMMQADLIDQILHTDYLDNAGIDEFEHIRECLRDLMKYIPVNKIIYDTDFDDEILSVDWKESELENDDLKNYKAKAEYYIRQHQDNAVIAKLKSNVPLTGEDIKVLEEILWSEIGTKQEYEAEYGQKPLGEFVREINGLDMNAAKAAFAEFLNDANLDSRQIYFVNQIVEYIVHNGMMKDLSVLQETPFTDQGSIVEIFTDLTVWMAIRKAIEQVNANALVTHGAASGREYSFKPRALFKAAEPSTEYRNNRTEGS